MNAGYGLPPAGPLHECISSLDDTGAMGFHYINGSLLDGKAQSGSRRRSSTRPNRNGKLPPGGARVRRLCRRLDRRRATDAVRRDVHVHPAPNRYEIPAFYSLHVWLWKHNPAGKFEPFNRRVSCDNA